MKKITRLLLALLLTPMLASAQSKLSIAPAAGFYKAKLDAFNEDLSALEDLGAKVEKPGGGLHFGGRLYYQKNTRWSWLAEVSIWKDRGEGRLQGLNGTFDFENQVRLVPIMLGSQYYFTPPKQQMRVYAGATGGIVLVNVQAKFNVNVPGQGQFSESPSASGNDFVSRPFIGLELANTNKMFFWGEVGYLIGKYSIEQTDPVTGATVENDVSINGLHFTGGVRFRL